jgi:hypothetical protein
LYFVPVRVYGRLIILQNQNENIYKRTIEINGIPGDAEYFIDGRKVSQLEGESMNPMT